MAEDDYDEFTRRMLSGEPMTEELWLSHFTHQNANASSGLDEGQPAPPFELPDAGGVTRTLDALVGQRGLVLAFARSAEW
jgi:hypothetical protein